MLVIPGPVWFCRLNCTPKKPDEAEELVVKSGLEKQATRMGGPRQGWTDRSGRSIWPLRKAVDSERGYE